MSSSTGALMELLSIQSQEWFPDPQGYWENNTNTSPPDTNEAQKLREKTNRIFKLLGRVEAKLIVIATILGTEVHPISRDILVRLMHTSVGFIEERIGASQNTARIATLLVAEFREMEGGSNDTMDRNQLADNLSLYKETLEDSYIRLKDRFKEIKSLCDRNDQLGNIVLADVLEMDPLGVFQLCTD